MKCAQNRRCTSSIYEQSLCKVWIKRNENFWSNRLHKLGTPKLANGQTNRWNVPTTRPIFAKAKRVKITKHSNLFLKKNAIIPIWSWTIISKVPSNCWESLSILHENIPLSPFIALLTCSIGSWDNSGRGFPIKSVPSPCLVTFNSTGFPGVVFPITRNGCPKTEIGTF